MDGTLYNMIHIEEERLLYTPEFSSKSAKQVWPSKFFKSPGGLSFQKSSNLETFVPGSFGYTTAVAWRPSWLWTMEPCQPKGWDSWGTSPKQIRLGRFWALLLEIQQEGALVPDFFVSRYSENCCIAVRVQGKKQEGTWNTTILAAVGDENVKMEDHVPVLATWYLHQSILN